MNTAFGWAFPDADVFMRSHLHHDGTYQASHLAAALTYVTDWTAAVDCGAHVGTWTRLMSLRFARVIAVEPSADTFEALTANLAAFNCANVEARQVAVGALAGTVTMILDGRGALLKNTGARYVRAKGPVPLETIDSWELQTLGFLKLDIEGSELAALQGARDTLRRCQPIVLFENKGLGRRFGEKPDACQTYLTKLGYRQRAQAGCDLIWGAA